MEVHEAAISASTAEVMELVDQLSALKGNVPTTSSFAASAGSVGNAGIGATTSSAGATSAAATADASKSRRPSTHNNGTEVTTAGGSTGGGGRQDVWLSMQRYRQVVRDSQEALSVFISEYMDLELHQQILCNKVYSLFLSLGQVYHTEQTNLWEESLQLFGNLLGDTMNRITSMGRPNPILQSPFAKLHAAEAASAAVSEGAESTEDNAPTTPTKAKTAISPTPGDVSPTPRQGRSSSEIQYEDFAAAVGVFSFVALYKDPLPLAPNVCISGSIMVAKGKDFSSTKENVLSAAIWRTVYAVVTSDGYLHILSRRKSDIPDISYCIKVSDEFI